jgi:hypothetical protein
LFFTNPCSTQKIFVLVFFPEALGLQVFRKGYIVLGVIYLLPAATWADAFKPGRINLMLLICIGFVRHTNAGGEVYFKANPGISSGNPAFSFKLLSRQQASGTAVLYSGKDYNNRDQSKYII